MIIECQTCHARFRLDESRIKGRGARVRCRKCGDSIVVLKEGATGAPSQGGDRPFDSGSAFRDSAPGSPAVPLPAGNLIPFPSAPRLTEPSAPQAEEPEKDEVELAFDRILSPGSMPPSGETKAANPPSVEWNVPAEHEVSVEPERRAEQDFGALTLDLVPEEKLDLPPAVTLDSLFEAPAADESAAGFPGRGGFLISDSDALDFLQEEHREKAPEPSPRIGDISLEISSTPVDATSAFLREPQALSAPGGDSSSLTLHEDLSSVTATGERDSPITGEDRTGSAGGGDFLEGNATPAALPDMEAPPPREGEAVPSPSVESHVPGGSITAESPRPRSNAWPAVAAVLAILLATIGYFGFTAQGRKTIEGAIPGIAAIRGGSPAAPGPQYDLRNVIGYYDSGAASSRILVIKGQVTNLSTAEKSGIRVFAALLDNNDAVLSAQNVYAGNTLSGEAIRKGKRDAMLKTLGNRFGEGLANMHVPPGKAIPFMVVFFDAPANIESYKLEAKDGE